MPNLVLSSIPVLVLKMNCGPTYNLTNLNICRVQSPPFWRVLDVQMCLGLVGLGHIWIIVDRKKVRIISRYFVTFLVLG